MATALQPELTSEYKLFLVVLGGRTRSSHIELHDVRWVVGKQIEDTFHQLRKEWFGIIEGLHIDSYLNIKFIDGYKVTLRRTCESNKCESFKSYYSSSTGKNKLWFVNFGGYDPKKLLELHEFGLFVAESAFEAKKLAKIKLLKAAEKRHNDNNYGIKRMEYIDNCSSINHLQEWQVHLSKDSKSRSQELIPDWYGFWRIDSYSQKELSF